MLYTSRVADAASHAPQPPTGFSLKRYEAADWPGFIELDVTNRMDERGLDPKEKDRFLKLRLLRLKNAYGFTESAPPPYPPHQLLVLRNDGGDYAGHCWLTDQTDVLTNEPAVRVTSIAISRSFRRHGLALYFLDLAESLARLRKAVELRVDVGTDNASAIRLFEKSGYAVRAQRMTKPL
jgi:ribosomal protein S18 acetylase RimI-like enzyme